MIECAQNPTQKEVAETISKLQNNEELSHCLLRLIADDSDYKAFNQSSNKLEQTDKTNCERFRKEVNRHSIYDLFDEGKTEFEKLPVLHFKNICLTLESIKDFRTATKDIKAPMVRGVDEKGVMFLVIFLLPKSGGERTCTLVIEDRCPNKGFMDKMAAFIKNGGDSLCKIG